MGTRRKARETAVQLLYELEMKQSLPTELFASRRQALDSPWSVRSVEGGEKKLAQDFARQIVEGVCDYREEIDQCLQRNALHWKLSRMSVIDKNILRMAVYEMIYCEEIPNSVAINEAIDIAKAFGSEDSGAFVNGVLDNIAKQLGGKAAAPGLKTQGES